MINYRAQGLRSDVACLSSADKRDGNFYSFMLSLFLLLYFPSRYANETGRYIMNINLHHHHRRSVRWTITDFNVSTRVDPETIINVYST